MKIEAESIETLKKNAAKSYCFDEATYNMKV